MSDALIRPNYKKATSEARRVLREFGVCEPPVNPVVLARDLGVAVRFVTFEGEYDSVSGFYDCETKEIMVNRHEFPLRQTFTVAHELGHKLLHEEWANSAAYTVLYRDPTMQNPDFREKEANAFAGELLMPRELMNDYYQLPASEISRIFAVSVPAVEARLAFLYGI